jgi:hypothetical protein
MAEDVAARDPDEVLLGLLFGFLGTQLLYVIAELGIADLIGEAPESVDVLAARSNARPDVLYRFLRALASLGVFVEVEERVFAQTPTSLLLRRDSGSGWHEFALVYGSVYRAFAEALPAVRDGEIMFVRAAGVGWWKWLANRPDAAAAFNQAMQTGAHHRLASIADFPWHEVRTSSTLGAGTARSSPDFLNSTSTCMAWSSTFPRLPPPLRCSWQRRLLATDARSRREVSLTGCPKTATSICSQRCFMTGMTRRHSRSFSVFAVRHRQTPACLSSSQWSRRIRNRGRRS